MIVLVVIAGALIAFVNGQNDVGKGIATLVGSGVTNYRRAIVWGAIWTGIGALAGSLIAGAMLATFGKGLLGAGVTPTFATALAVVFGAAAWVLIATRTGLPVSTTHAIIGALTGVALVAFGMTGVRWDAIEHKLLVPLLVGPFIALAATAALLRIARWHGGIADCACVVAPAPRLVSLGGGGIGRLALSPPTLMVASSAACAAQPVAARVTMDHLHWATSGAASFARGLNDAPKIVALILAGAALTGSGIAPASWFAIVTAAMVAGSLWGGLHVTRVLAENVTRMDHREGFVANLVTALLVGLGAWQGLPLSTTHVSTGAIIGAGTTRASAIDWRTVRGMALAWVVTIPLAAGLAITTYGLLVTVGV
ncbi:MAG: inorganic phosphate transporter [Deltaproteobacteria bacterium]